MSYIPARAMHRAAPATHDHAEETSPAVAPTPAQGLFSRLANRLSPRAWTAVAIVAGAVAAGITASAMVDDADQA